MNPDLRLRAFYAVRQGVEGWELIRELAAALEKAETKPGGRERAAAVSETANDRLNAMFDAQKRYEQAAHDLVVATETALPIGTEVAVTLGRARIRGRVTDSGGSWWYRPSQIIIRNNETLKTRRFDACSDLIELTVITESQKL